jgi:integrase
MNRQQSVRRQMQAYLEYRQALGFELQTSRKLLPQFARFLDRSGHHGPLTVDLILRWVHLPQTATRGYKSNRLSVARGFARYLTARDGQTEVPGWRLIPQAFFRRPYAFSERQLEQLLVASGQMKPSFPLRPLTYRTLFGLLASTGLRICEALKLTRGNVDLEHGILRIERTKFKKSRLMMPTMAARSSSGSWSKSTPAGIQ